MKFVFQNLPEKIVKSIFQSLTFEKLVELRLVSKWFDSICSQILNQKFLSVKNDLETEICALNDLYNNHERVFDIQLKYKILQVMRNEILTLYVVCGRYVKEDCYTFSGGTILDSIYTIMNKKFDLATANNPLECERAMMLFLMCEEFSDHFEVEIEPKILNTPFCPWYGSKIVDFLDLYLHCNYHITATYKKDKCQVSARYEILNPDCLSELKLNEFECSKEKLRMVARYIRNQMRWHNFFFYVDARYETINSNKRKDRKYNKFCLNLNEGNVEIGDDILSDKKCTKTFSRRLGNPCAKENVSFAVELQCNKDLMPCRLKMYEPKCFSEDTSDDSGLNSYDFLLTLKLALPSDEKESVSESYLELYHNSNNCEITQRFKEIPI